MNWITIASNANRFWASHIESEPIYRIGLSTEKFIWERTSHKLALSWCGQNSQSLFQSNQFQENAAPTLSRTASQNFYFLVDLSPINGVTETKNKPKWMEKTEQILVVWFENVGHGGSTWTQRLPAATEKAIFSTIIHVDLATKKR